MRLGLRGYTFPLEIDGVRAPAGRRFLRVEVFLENVRSEAPVPAVPAVFRVETGAGTAHEAISASSCGAALLEQGRSASCDLVFDLPVEGRPSTLLYDALGRSFSASFAEVSGPPPLCPVPSDESTVAACNDGCNNDGDPYLDCDDADCCAVRSDCASGTYCGGSQTECVSGPETTVAGCEDACDNEGDDQIDCGDSGCCDLVACGSDTYCGQQPSPFEGLLTFDDVGIAAVDPGTLRAGEQPCRAPVLVNVDWVNDGDTFEVSGPIEGPVRMIGIDTPEVGHNGEPSDCYGPEAFDFTRQLRDHRVWLTFDAECADRYGRHLAYVHVGGGSADLWQRQLLRRGFARVYTVRGNDRWADLFAHDSALAAAEGKGLWSACP